MAKRPDLDCQATEFASDWAFLGMAQGLRSIAIG